MRAGPDAGVRVQPGWLSISSFPLDLLAAAVRGFTESERSVGWRWVGERSPLVSREFTKNEEEKNKNIVILQACRGVFACAFPEIRRGERTHRHTRISLERQGHERFTELHTGSLVD